MGLTEWGIVHHSNYIRWMEEARTDVLEQRLDFLMKQRLREQGILITGFWAYPVITVFPFRYSRSFQSKRLFRRSSMLESK